MVVSLQRKQPCRKHEYPLWRWCMAHRNMQEQCCTYILYMWFSWYIWGVKNLHYFRTVWLLSRSDRKVLPCRSVPGWSGQRTQVYLQRTQVYPQQFQTAWCKKSMWLSRKTLELFLKGNSMIWFSWCKLRFGGFLAYRVNTQPTPCRKT